MGTTMEKDKWFAQRKQAEMAEKERARLMRKQGYAMTRAAILRTKKPEGPPEPLWTMRKFRQAQPTVSTFRSGAARERAVDQHGQAGCNQSGLAKALVNPVMQTKNRALLLLLLLLPLAPSCYTKSACLGFLLFLVVASCFV